MKCRIIIDKNHEEEVIIYAHERNETVESIEKFVSAAHPELIGYSGKSAEKFSLSEIYCFTVEGNKVYALTKDDKLQIKQRLYQIEEIADESFVKINQSCIVKVKCIKRFDASVSGTLRVTLKNGYTDYVSRRQLKAVKERLGL